MKPKRAIKPEESGELPPFPETHSVTVLVGQRTRVGLRVISHTGKPLQASAGGWASDANSAGAETAQVAIQAVLASVEAGSLRAESQRKHDDAIAQRREGGKRRQEQLHDQRTPVTRAIEQAAQVDFSEQDNRWPWGSEKRIAKAALALWKAEAAKKADAVSKEEAAKAEQEAEAAITSHAIRKAKKEITARLNLG